MAPTRQKPEREPARRRHSRPWRARPNPRSKLSFCGPQHAIHLLATLISDSQPIGGHVGVVGRSRVVGGHGDRWARRRSAVRYVWVIRSWVTWSRSEVVKPTSAGPRSSWTRRLGLSVANHLGASVDGLSG